MLWNIALPSSMADLQRGENSENHLGIANECRNSDRTYLRVLALSRCLEHAKLTSRFE